MRVLRRYRFMLVFLALLVFCSVMVVRTHHRRQGFRVEVREAFILLHTRGYTEKAQVLYKRLLLNMHKLSNRQLTDDFQRTLLLVDPSVNQPENLIWKYHLTVGNELGKRTESSLIRALELADTLEAEAAGEAE